MEIQQLTSEQGEIYSPLHDIFEKAMGRLPDWMRNHDILDHWLFLDGGATRLFVVDGTPAVVIVSDVVEDLSATVLLLNPEEAEPGAILRELREIMNAWNLKRLTAQVPGPVKDVQKVLKEVGFRREGHLRRATYWNGRLCGMDVYGIYKDQPRRKKKQAPEPAKSAEAETPSSNGENNNDDNPEGH